MNLSGIPTFFQTLKRLQQKEATDQTLNRIEILYSIAFQVIILGLLSLFCNPFYYFVFYLFPLVSVAKLLAQLRGLAEHGDPTGKVVLRSFLGKSLISKFMGVYGFSFHAEHHLIVSVPYFKLQDINEHLLNAPEGFSGKEVQVYEGGHLQLLYQWFMTLPWIKK